MNWKILTLFGLLTVLPLEAQAQRPRVSPPKLINRAEIIAERQRIANRVLQRGDSMTIMVYAYVNEKGLTMQPDIKVPSGNAAADTAALKLVRMMRWVPAQNASRGVMVSLPVKLVRK